MKISKQKTKAVILGWLLIVLIAGSHPVLAESEFEYQPAVLLKDYPWEYPRERQLLWQAGMVEMDIMVDTEGSVFDPVVIRSTHPGFEKAALRAVSRFIYEPARYAGNPVNSNSSVRMLFVFGNGKTRPVNEFGIDYRVAKKLLEGEKDQQKRVRKILDRMADRRGLESHSLAYLYMLESMYAERYLDVDSQIDAIKNLLLFEGNSDEKRRFITSEMHKSLTMNIIKLLITTGRYSEAIAEYRKLKSNYSDAAAHFEPIIQEIDNMVDEGTAFKRSLNFGKRDYVLTRLLTGKFYLTDVQGHIDKIKFRCDRYYTAVDFQPTARYQIPENWGDCKILLVGEKSTTADLVQL